MNVKRSRWLAALGVSLGLSSLLPAQQPVVWRAAGAVTQPAKPPLPQPRTHEVGNPGAGPIASLGRPVAIAPPAKPIIRGQSAEYENRLPPPPTANPGLNDTTPGVAGGPEPGVTIPLSFDLSPKLDTPRTGVAPPQPHVVEAPPDDLPPPPVNPFPSSGDTAAPGVITDQPVAPGFWDKCVDAVTFGDKGSTHGRHAFGSDSCFPGMVSPITMPFYFEDPRSLSEVRPIFSYQAIPDGNQYTKGGDAIFFGTQFRLSFTDRLSVVINEFGFLSISPDQNAGGFSSDTGFAELKLGPKWTFLRNTDTGTVGAVGLTFEIPCGGGGVFQNNGVLSIDPYLSLAQSVNLGGGWGSLNFMGTTGYSFSVNDNRAEFYYLNFHVDYNIAGLNTIYPLFECNWMHYGNTPNGNPNFNFEGSYLINFGAGKRQSNDWVSLAGGLRFRIGESVVTGIAAELPVTTEKGFADYRIIFDVIFRF